MKEMKLTLCALFIGYSLLHAPLLKAQFAGDLFFDGPSVAIPEGGRGTLEIQAFSGTDTFGAAQFELVFNADQLEVLAVRPGDTPELQKGLTIVRSEGSVSIIVVNSGSLDVPFGTSSLVEIDVRPLAPAGSVIFVANEVTDVLRQDSTPYASPAGLGAEIVVTTAGTSVASSSGDREAGPEPVVEAEPGTALYDRVVALRRPGAVVTLVETDQNGDARRLRVTIPRSGTEDRPL